LVGCFSYHVSTWDGRSWSECGVLHFDGRYREQELDLGSALPDPTGAYRVRIRQSGLGAARVESVALLSGDRGARERRITPSAAADGEVLSAIAARDFRSLDLHDKEIELRFSGVHRGPLRLALTAIETRERAGGAVEKKATSAALEDSAAASPFDPFRLLPTFGTLLWAPNDRELAFLPSGAGEVASRLDLDDAGRQAPLLVGESEILRGAF